MRKFPFVSWKQSRGRKKARNEGRKDENLFHHKTMSWWARKRGSQDEVETILSHFFPTHTLFGLIMDVNVFLCKSLDVLLINWNYDSKFNKNLHRRASLCSSWLCHVCPILWWLHKHQTANTLEALQLHSMTISTQKCIHKSPSALKQ